jgi:ribose 1,5-bisphosphokinase PhnN
MITRDSIETAYSFLHQKRQVYIHSQLDWQKDDIEYAIASYVDDMSHELYDMIANGRDDFLREHSRFLEDITKAVEQLEGMLCWDWLS